MSKLANIQSALDRLRNGTTQISVIRPSLAAFITPNSNVAAWTLGAYTQLVAAADLAAHELVGLLLAREGAVTQQFNIEIATGGAGVEVVVGRTVFQRMATNDAEVMYVPVPAILIPANARVAIRCADSVGNGNFYCAGIFMPRPS